MVSERFCRNLDSLIIIGLTLEQNLILRPLKRSMKSIPEFYSCDPVEPSSVCVCVCVCVCVFSLRTRLELNPGHTTESPGGAFKHGSAI